MSSREATKKKATGTPVVEDQYNLSEFVRHLSSVNIKNPDAKQNETTMSDNKGKRIIFNEEHLKYKTFKGVEVPRRPYKKI